MDTQLLSAFLAVADAASFSVAAERLHLTQPAVSKRIAALEEQLGVRLTIGPGPREVRSLRGLTILVHEQPGLCRKTRKAIPEAIKKSMERHPEIVYALLNAGGLFEGL